MTKRMTDDELMEARDRARGRADDRAYDQIMRRERELDKLRAELMPLVGELQGENGHRFYVNLRSTAGRLTGAIREFPTNYAAIAFLVRNDYAARV